MTAKQIETELKKTYPLIHIVPYPIHTLGLDGISYNNYWVESGATTRDVIGEGRTPRKAWVAAYEYVKGPDLEKDKKAIDIKQKKQDAAYNKRKAAIEALPDNTMFYWQSYGYVGNCLNLWAEGGSGYTTNIAKAGLFTKQQTLGQLACRRDQDEFWEKDHIQGKCVYMVDMQDVDNKYKY